MRLRNISLMAVAVGIALFAGCGGPASWQIAQPGHNKFPGRLGFSVDIPENWMTFADQPSRTLLLSRHSMLMDLVQITRYPLPASFGYTNRTINAHMKTYEVAEVVIGNLRASSGTIDVAIEELAPYIIGGREGFRIFGRYGMENGLFRRFLIYGFIHDGKYYTELSLYALEDYYFNAVVGDFTALVDSFRF